MWLRISDPCDDRGVRSRSYKENFARIGVTESHV